MSLGYFRLSHSFYAPRKFNNQHIGPGAAAASSSASHQANSASVAVWFKVAGDSSQLHSHKLRLQAVAVFFPSHRGGHTLVGHGHSYWMTLCRTTTRLPGQRQRMSDTTRLSQSHLSTALTALSHQPLCQNNRRPSKRPRSAQRYPLHSSRYKHEKDEQRGLWRSLRVATTPWRLAF